MNILLLTNSVLFERKFVSQLNFLGHEVMCSKQLLIDLQEQTGGKEMINYFTGLIFSETVTDKEMKKVIDLNSHAISLIYRKTDKTLTSEEQLRLKELGIVGFFSQQSTLDDYRECLSEAGEVNLLAEVNKEEAKEAALKELYVDLSSQEKKLFAILEDKNGDYITRDEVCRQLWGGDPTNSMECRLSEIVKKLRLKMKAAGFNSSYLVTSWGKGYRLKELSLQEYTIRNETVLTK